MGRVNTYALKTAAVACALTGWMWFCAVAAVKRLQRDTFSDFDVFYLAARAFLHHADPYAIHAFQNRRYIYPPLIAFIYVPLALLPQRQAAIVALCFNVLCIALALFIATRECLRRLEVPAGALALAGTALLAALLLADKVKGELQMFQTNAMLLLLLTLALHWLDRRPVWAGLALGFAFNIKYIPIIMLPYLMIRRRWHAAGAMVISAVGFSFLPAVYSGWNTNLTHLSVAFGGLQHMVGLDTAGDEVAGIDDITAGYSRSITSAVARATIRLNVEDLTLPIAAIMAAGVVTIIALMYRRNALPFWRWPKAAGQLSQPYRGIVALEWAGLIVGVLTFSPQTNTRHWILLLPATALLSVMLLFPRRGTPRMPLVLGAALLLFGLTFPWGGTQTPWARRLSFWNTMGGSSWCILGMYGLLAWAGLRYAYAVAAAQPRVGPAPLDEPNL